MKKKTLGLAFKDEMSKVTRKTGHFQEQKEKSWTDSLIPNYTDEPADLSSDNWKSILAGVFTIILFFGIFLRLFHLQVVMGSQMRQLADGNRVKVQIIHAPRGVIYDRNGKVLAANSPGFRLTDQATKKTRYISREDALDLEVKNDPQAANLEVDNIRYYPAGEETAHALGYLGQISADQLKDDKYKSYTSGDLIGQTGIEYYYEEYLKGKDGGEIYEIDSKGKKVRILREIPPIAGKNLYLSIDSDLQHLTYTKLKEATAKVGSCCAAAVIENPQTGEILTDVSIPSYDNNIFTKNVNENAIADILTRSDSPVLNRSISGTYPPGSTFKIVSSMAALGSGKITPQTIFQDNGVMALGPYTFSNWYFTEYGKTEGPVDIIKAIARSNDIYFYHVGQEVGEKTLGDYAKKLGMGKTLGIDLPGEATGLVPTDQWKQDNFGQVWYPGDTLHMAIGQGFTLATPLQVLGFTSYVAAGGNLYQPHLLLRMTDDNERVTKTYDPRVLSSKVVSETNLALVRKGLEEVPLTGGTAWPFFIFPIKTAGKTGTAEYGDPKNKTHAWYTAYAPIDDPKIAATVLIEGGGEGSNVSAPIVKEVFRWFLSPDKTKLIKDVSPIIATESAKTLGE